jgi:hypothetical protein
MVRSEDWFGSRREFDRMPARHELQSSEFDHARKQFQERMDGVWLTMDAAGSAFERAVGSGVGALLAARLLRDRFGAWPLPRGGKELRRGLEGGEPVPVMPRPRPTPLMDGAEAPIE